MKKQITYFLLLFFSIPTLWAQIATVKGTVTNVFGDPVPNINVNFKTQGTTTNKAGKFELVIPANKKVLLKFSHVSYVTVVKNLRLQEGETKTLYIEITEKIEKIDKVHIEAHKKNIDGITVIKGEVIKVIPSSSGSLKEVVVGTALGASTDNDLSTQYKVRGGNYDENLVYVNGIEVYRPFLVRSGQQEGLSFVNVDMTDNVKFSSGGFQAKYGDKLSSVLDISYRTPKEFGFRADLSMLGASITTEGATENTTAILGLRYRDNGLLVDSKDIAANYDPRFADIQTFITHRFNEKVSLGFLGNFALNDYRYIPTRREAKFGTLSDPLKLIVDYQGTENDQYYTSFGALDLKYDYDEKLDFSITTSLFNTQEEEYYDIAAAYALGSPTTDAGSEDYGETEYTEGIGSQLNHARNALDALIGNIQAKANYKNGKSDYQFGAKYQIENIRDQLVEWEVIDSAGFSLRPPGHVPNLQPYEAFEGPIVPYQNLQSESNTDLQRITAFGQWNYKDSIYNNAVWTSVGVRLHQWNIDNTSQYVISPRAQITVKPKWEKDMLFRLSGGIYAQPPMYRELRDVNGVVQSEVKAQKSTHLVLGGDYSFKMWERPFKLVTEAYYKHITDANPYTLDNVRIRYAANNNAVAYAKGIDLRLNGEFVPGTESWFNFGYLKTQENIDDKGYISRPSDQRLKFSLLFQDYVPTMPQLKMYMNLVYNTGVPGGSPTYADPYDFQSRLGDYKRADIGIFYVLKDDENPATRAWLGRFKELSIGGEIFNLFDMNNAITNTWVRDIYTKQMYGIKNNMTGRVFNIRVKVAL